MGPRGGTQNRMLSRNPARGQLNPSGNYERRRRNSGGIIRGDSKNPHRFSIVVCVGKLSDMISRLAGRYMAFRKMGVDDSLVLVHGPAVVPMLFGGVQMEKWRSDECQENR